MTRGTGQRATPSTGESIRYIGDYEIIDEIARGGMGVVYKAKQKTLGRTVALKMILSGELASEHEVQRFYGEAEAAAGLDHPGIVPIFEVGSYGDHHYFSMALIEGPSLASEMRQGPLPVDRAVKLTRQIAEAVQYAHSKDVIHRDLKPGNVLLDDADRPHITDFGLAKRGDGADLTASGQVLGTPAYMPPEQARGATDLIGVRSDVYSIGAMLYAMLLGRPPHAADSAVETLRQVVDVEPPSVRSLNPAIPRDLETICQTCLAKTPAQRYESAQEIADELGRYQRGEPIHARPVSFLEKSIRWAKRKPAAAALAATLVLFTGLLAVGGPAVALKQASLRQEAESNEQLAKQSANQERLARSEADESRRLLAEENLRNSHALYARTLSLAYGQFRQGNLTGAEDSLASTNANLRGFEWEYLNRLCNSELQRYLGLTAATGKVAITADGNHVVASQTGGTPTLFVWHVDETQPIAKHAVVALALSRDGSKAAMIDPAEPGTIRLMDPVSGTTIGSMKSVALEQRVAVFGGPGEGLLGLVTNDRHVRVFDTQTGKEVAAIKEEWRRKLHPIAISQAGDRVAWRRRDDNAVVIHELPSGRRLFEGPVDPSMRDFACPVQFSPDGSVLAVGGYEQVEIRDAVTGQVRQRFSGLRGHSISLDFAPDGKRLAVTCRDGSVRVFRMGQAQAVATMTGHHIGVTYGVLAVAFDASGDRLVSVGADNFVKLWDAYQGDQKAVNQSNIAGGFDRPRANQELDYLTTPEHMIEHLRIVDGGRKLLCASRDQSVRVFDLDKQQEERSWTDLGDNQGCVDLSTQTASIVCGGGSLGDAYPGVVKCFDTESGDERWTSDAASGPINRVRFMNAGTQIAVSVGSQVVTRGELFVLDAATGEVVWKTDKFPAAIRDIDISPDGQTIRCVGNFNGIVSVDSQTGEPKNAFGDRPCFSIDHSSDGSLLAVGARDWSIRLFDLATQQQRWVSRRHSGAVCGVQFAGDDRRLVSVALDGTTRIWDTTYGDELVSLVDDGSEKFSLAVSDDGSHVAVGGVNDTVLIRQMKPTADPLDDIEWVEIAYEDFANEISDDWEQAVGEWSIEDGRAVGSLKTNPAMAILQSAALYYRKPIVDAADVEYDLRVEVPMLVETKFSDRAATNAVHALAIGMPGSPFNRGERGAAMLVTASGVFREVGSRRGADFGLEAGRDYRIRTRRWGDRLDMYVDGQLFRSSRIPIDVPLIQVMVHGFLGPADGRLSIDNLRVRVPAGTEALRYAAKLVEEQFKKGMLKPLVVADLKHRDIDQLIESNPKLSAKAVRREAIALANRWDQSTATVLYRARLHATANDLEAEQYTELREWIRSNVPEVNEETYRTLAMLSYRLDDLGDAWDMWKESNRSHVAREAYKHPIDAALESLFLHTSDQTKPAQASRRRLDQLVLAKSLVEDNANTQAWVQEAREAIELPKDDVYDVLTQRVHTALHAMIVDKDLTPLDNLLADDAVIAIRRLGEKPEHEFTRSRSDYLESQRLFANGTRHGFGLITQSANRRKIGDNTVQISSENILKMPQGHVVYQHFFNFRTDSTVPPSEWKATRHIRQIVGLRADNNLTHVSKGDWGQWDADVDAMPDVSGKVNLLALGGRAEDALELATRLCQQSETPNDHVAKSVAGWFAAKPAAMREAIKRVVTLDANDGQRNGPPMVHHFYAKANLGDAIDLASNVGIRVPTHYRRGATAMLGAGDKGLAVFQADDAALLAILRGDAEDLADGVTQAIETRKAAFGCELLSRNSIVVDGFPAESFIMKGLGMGWAVGGGNIPTLQRFVIVDRSQDMVTLLHSCEERVFEKRDSEFGVILDSLRLSEVSQDDE